MSGQPPAQQAPDPNQLASFVERLDVNEPAPSTAAVLLDSLPECAAAIAGMVADAIENNEPVAVDFEGVDLCRDGELCLAQLAPAKGPVLLVDVAALGQDAFDKGGLKGLLESEKVLKLWFDVRTDSDALWHKHAVWPKNAYDVQIAYCTARDKRAGRRDRFLKGLGAALEDCALIPIAERRRLESVKRQGVLLFAPEKGGSYQVWASRPLDPRLAEYAAADVRHLHTMAAEHEWTAPASTVVGRTDNRIRKAIHSPKAAKGRHMALKDF